LLFWYWKIIYVFTRQWLRMLSKHLSSPPFFSGVRVTRSLVWCVCFVDRCLFFCTFSLGHCVVFTSSICGFWLPLGIFKLFFYLFETDILVSVDILLFIVTIQITMRYQCYHMHDYDLMANTKTDRERCHLDLYVNPSTYILLIPFCVHKIFQIVSLSCQRLGLLCTFHNMSVIYKDCQLYWRRKP
jgi:hypothetical protein